MALRPYVLASNGVYASGNGVYPRSATAIVDDFETGNLNGWADTATGCSVQQSTVQQGSYALQLDPGHSSMDSLPGSGGLANYPSAGDEFNVWFNTTSTGRTYVRFFYDGSSNWYGLLLDPGSDVDLRKDGGSTTISSMGLSGTADGNWHRINVDWASNGDYTISAYDASGTQHNSMSGNDTAYTSGGVGFLDVDSTAAVYIDNWHIV